LDTGPLKAGQPVDPVADAVLTGFWQHGWPALQAALDPRVFKRADEAHRPGAQSEAAPGPTRAALAQYAQADPRAVPLLLDRLAHDPSPYVREKIALLLTNRAAEPAIQYALQPVLRTDPELRVRWAASYAMRLADRRNQPAHGFPSCL
jgi:HEAT repeats